MNNNFTSEESLRFSKYLLDNGAVTLKPYEPFTWTSGIQSPIYCDNRILLSIPEVREFVVDTLATMVVARYGSEDIIIAGISTAGIPWGMGIAEKLGLPFCYVRPEPKAHGKKNQIEGLMPKGSKVVLVEDLISTGKSSLLAANAVREEGSVVLGLVGLFTYGFTESEEKFKEANVPFITISNFTTLCDVGSEFNYIERSQLELVKSFATDPKNWKAA